MRLVKPSIPSNHRLIASTNQGTRELRVKAPASEIKPPNQIKVSQAGFSPVTSSRDRTPNNRSSEIADRAAEIVLTECRLEVAQVQARSEKIASKIFFALLQGA